eukprot:tig00020710_g13236.t1
MSIAVLIDIVASTVLFALGIAWRLWQVRAMRHAYAADLVILADIRRRRPMRGRTPRRGHASTSLAIGSRASGSAAAPAPPPTSQLSFPPSPGSEAPLTAPQDPPRRRAVPGVARHLPRGPPLRARGVPAPAEGDEAALLPCSHAFHYRYPCLARWVAEHSLAHHAEPEPPLRLPNLVPDTSRSVDRDGPREPPPARHAPWPVRAAPP